MNPFFSAIIASLLYLTTVVAYCTSPDRCWDLKEFKSLVTFGDSYTDESRLDYFASNGQAPPAGWVPPFNPSTAGGGITWPRWVSLYTITSLYNYAVSGAVCSNAVTSRWFSPINAHFPDIASYQLSAFFADAAYTAPGANAPFLHIPPASTVYAQWIGTNDLGNGAFLTDSQVAGKTIKDYVDCVYSSLDRAHAAGGRYFVLMNVPPLQLAPQYATDANGGVAKSRYWPDKPTGIGDHIAGRMGELVVAVNEIFNSRTWFEMVVKRKWPGARVALFDVNGLITDIYNQPSLYLNDTVPANVTGFISHCEASGCSYMPSADSYLWFDELHISQQANRVVARAFVEVVQGKSRWATYWGPTGAGV